MLAAPEPPPPFKRRRHLGLAALGFAALLMLPTPLVLAVGIAALGARVAWRDLKHVRHRDARIARRAVELGGIEVGTGPSGNAVVIPPQALAAHGLIVGATGAGKSTTLLTLLTQQVENGRPVVAIDLKGSPGFARQLRASAEAAGRRFVQWTPDGGAQWNPLAVGNATELKDKLLATERFTEPHYRRAAERYLQLAIQVAQETGGTEQVTLRRVVELLTPERLAVATRALPPARGEYIREYLSSLTPDQHSAVRGLGSRLAILTESHTGPYLESAGAGPTVDLRQALTGNQVVLFSLNSSTYGGLSALLGTLAVQDLVAAAGSRLATGQPPRLSATVGIDEFSALGSDNVMALLARGREAGVGVLLATQELADLDRAGRGVRDQVLGNTALKIAHRQDVPQSAEAVAKLAGTVRVWDRSYQQRPGRLGGGGRAGGGLSGLSGLARLGGEVTSSARLVERYAIEPDSVRTLGTGQAVVIIKSPEASAQVTQIRRQPSAAVRDQRPAIRPQPPAPGVTR